MADFLRKHPCASLLFDYVISEIDFDEELYPKEVIALIELFNNETYNTVEDGNSKKIVTIKNVKIIIDEIPHPTLNLNGKAIANNISNYLREKKITKAQAQNFYKILQEYNESLIEQDAVVSRNLTLLNDILKQNWKGDKVVDYRDLSRRYLNSCVRRIK